MTNVKAYVLLLKYSFKAKTMYKFNFIVEMLIPLLAYFINYLTVWLIMFKYKSIQSWNFNEILFNYNINLFGYAVAGLFLHQPMMNLGEQIKSGSLDLYLMKPINVLTHLIVRMFYPVFLTHITFSILVFYYCISKLTITITAMFFVYLFIGITGSVLMHMGCMLLCGATSFIFLESSSLMFFYIYGIKVIFDFPLIIYPKAIRSILIDYVPFSYFNFKLSNFLLKNQGNTLTPFISLIIGIIMIICGLFLWKKGVENYTSSGS